MALEAGKFKIEGLHLVRVSLLHHTMPEGITWKEEEKGAKLILSETNSDNGIIHEGRALRT